MIYNKPVTAIILAAGNSVRFGKNRNKNFETIKGKSILSYSINAFEENKAIDDIIIAIKQEEKESIEKIIMEEKRNKKIQLINGGECRAESVYNCIKKAKGEIVVIHDGARPLIKQKYIDECLKNIQEYEAVSMGVRSKDTIKITDEKGIVKNTTNRENTWLVQTPQCFIKKTLIKAYEKCKIKAKDITDDCILLEQNNIVKMIPGDYTNIKVTTYDDINLIKVFLQNN